MSSLPKTYKAVQQVKKGEPFQIIDVDLKQPQKGEVLIKVLACGVCHSDGIVKMELFPVLPRIPGHEVIGEIVAVGEDAGEFKVGDRVGGGWHGHHCGTNCDSCRSGDFGTCSHELVNGVSRDGGYAEYCTLMANSTVRIPTDVDPAEAAPLLCAGVTVFNSMRNMGYKPGDLVAIQGIGGLGHLALQYASKMGFKVAALSSSDSKKDLATSLGANEYIDGSKGSQSEALQKLGGAKLIVCTAPSSDVINDLISGLAVNGTLLILAIPSESINLPVLPMIQKRLSVRGWPSGTAKHSEEAVQFAKEMGVKCQIEKYPLEDADKAFESMTSGKVRFRAVLVPGYKA